MAKNRSIVYIDGFNLYYGALKRTPYKWLNLEAYFRRLRSDDSIQRIYYFTAMVREPGSADQLAYLSALRTLPLVTIIQGKFKWREHRCRVAGCHFPGDRIFAVPEEKRTDVNIAVQMMDDAGHDRADRFVLVTGDSDLLPVLQRIRERFPAKKLILYLPAPSAHHVRAAATELRSVVDRSNILPLHLLAVSQFPPRILTADGDPITKPADW